MRELRWVSRGEKPVIRITLDADSAQWIADHIPRGDSAHEAIVEALADVARREAAEDEFHARVP